MYKNNHYSEFFSQILPNDLENSFFLEFLLIEYIVLLRAYEKLPYNLDCKEKLAAIDNHFYRIDQKSLMRKMIKHWPGHKKNIEKFFEDNFDVNSWDE